MILAWKRLNKLVTATAAKLARTEHDKDCFSIGDEITEDGFESCDFPVVNDVVVAGDAKKLKVVKKAKKRKVVVKEEKPATKNIYLLPIFALLGVVGLFVAAGYWVVEQQNLLPVKRIQVESKLQQLSQQQLQNVISPLVDSGLLGINVADIKQQLETIAWVDKADVRIIWPDALRINVKEQIPTARWGDGKLLNTRGEIFAPQIMSEQFNNLPYLNGPQGQERKVAQMYLLVREVLESRGIDIASIQLDERRAWSITTADDVAIKLGKSDVDSKITRFLKGYDKKLSEHFAQIAYVDLRYTNGFAVKMKDQAQPGKENIKRTHSNG